MRRGKQRRKRVARSAPRPQAATSKPAAKGRNRVAAPEHAVATHKLVRLGVQQKLSELRAERDRISHAISALEALDGDGLSGGLKGGQRVAAAALPQNGRTGTKPRR